MNVKTTDWAALSQFATDSEKPIIDALAKLKTWKLPGKNRGTVFKLARRVADRAALRGWAPDCDMTKLAPPTHFVKGVSNYYGQDGKLKGQWVKTSARAAAMEAYARELSEAFREDIIGLAVPTVAAPLNLYSDDLSIYPIGDMHLGMMSHGEETGTDWDLKQAQEMLGLASGYLFERAFSTRVALILNVGDFLHADNYAGVTEHAGNRLDVDTRWHKMLRVGTDCLRTMIDRALLKHEHVHVINVPGNHDHQGAYMLSLFLDAYYRNEPRVTIDTTPGPYKFFSHGGAYIMGVHGDGAKPKQFLGIMLDHDGPGVGNAKTRYAISGHIHHDNVQELDGGLIWMSLETLSPKDAWHHWKGYLAGRSMKYLCLDHETGVCHSQYTFGVKS